MKIFIGTYNIASQLNDWKYGFEQNGCLAKIGSYGSHTHLVSGNFDYLLKYRQEENKYLNYLKYISFFTNNKKDYSKQRRSFLKKIIGEFDVFFIVWEGILDNFDDFEIIKDSGKKLIVQFVGDDIRWEPAMKQEFNQINRPPIEYHNYDFSLHALNRRLSFLRKAEKYADLIYSYPNQSQLMLREYGVNNYTINTNDFKFNPIQRKVPKIVHFPSDSLGKGSKYVYDSISKINNNISFDFESTGQSINYGNQKNAYSYSDIKLKYLESDILIGQLLCSGGGRQERELLSCGKVVLSNMTPSYEKHLPINNPIIDVNTLNLTEKLEEIILDYPHRVELANRAREFVELHHNPVIITARIIDEINSGKHQGYTYKPTFFRQDYIPENEEYSRLYNKWTEFVSKEEWYTRSIPSGERSGLIF